MNPRTKHLPIAAANTLAVLLGVVLTSCSPANSESVAIETLPEEAHDESIELSTELMFQGEQTAKHLKMQGVQITVDETPPSKGMFIARLVRETKNSTEPLECLLKTEIQSIASSVPEDWTQTQPHEIEIVVQPSPLGTPIKQAKQLRITTIHHRQSYQNPANGQSASSGTSPKYLIIKNPFYGDYTGTFTTGPSETKFSDEGLILIESESSRYLFMIDRVQ